MRNRLALVVALAALSGCGSRSLKVESVEGNDSCSRLTDYCVRVSCTVTNKGKLPAEGLLEISVPQGNKPTLSYSQPVKLKAGESRKLSHDFPEAELVASDGARPTCEVK